jgi:hypothetical protein
MLNQWNAQLDQARDLDPQLMADARQAVDIGLQALDYARGSRTPSATWAASSLATLKSLSDNHREIVIAICPGVRALVNAYGSTARSAPQ